MKKKKLNLDDLKVQSFVTNLEGENAEAVKGGATIPNCTSFNTNCVSACGTCTCNTCFTDCNQNTCGVNCVADR